MSTETEAVAEDQEQVQEVAETVEQPSEQQEQAPEQTQEEAQPEEKAEGQVPISALQKERRKRQEAEQKTRWYEEMHAKQSQGGQSNAPQESDDDQYEAATKADLKNVQKAALREFEEKSWAKGNPEKVEDITDNLTEFLKQRPHLASAIENAPNRYEEAWMLMNALSPRQKTALKVPPVGKKPAPGSPTSVPKGAGAQQTMNVMDMSDTEFRTWRQSQRKRR